MTTKYELVVSDSVIEFNSIQEATEYKETKGDGSEVISAVEYELPTESIEDAYEAKILARQDYCKRLIAEVFAVAYSVNRLEEDVVSLSAMIPLVISSLLAGNTLSAKTEANNAKIDGVYTEIIRDLIVSQIDAYHASEV